MAECLSTRLKLGEINHLQTEDPDSGNFPFTFFKKAQKWVEDEGGCQNGLVFNILHELQWEGYHGMAGLDKLFSVHSDKLTTI